MVRDIDLENRYLRESKMFEKGDLSQNVDLVCASSMPNQSILDSSGMRDDNVQGANEADGHVYIQRKESVNRSQEHLHKPNAQLRGDWMNAIFPQNILEAS